MTKKRRNTGAQITSRIPLKRRKVEQNESPSEESESWATSNENSCDSGSDSEEELVPLTKEELLMKDIIQKIFPTMIPTLNNIVNSPLNIEAKRHAIKLFLETIKQSTSDEDEISATDQMFLWENFHKKYSDMLTPGNYSDHQTDSFIDFLSGFRRALVPNLKAILHSSVSQEKQSEALEIFRIYHDPETEPIQRLELGKSFRKVLRGDEKYLNNKIAISQLETTQEIKDILLHQLDRENEDGCSRGKIKWYLKLPFEREIILKKSVGEICDNVYDALEKKVYGLRNAKEEIMMYVNDHFSQRNTGKRMILALKGNPGTGKTKLASSIAEAVGLPFEKISLGGISDATILRGSQSVWIGAAPSLLLQKLSHAKCCNPVILLDEIDKVSPAHGHHSKEIYNTLLHILDYEQNSKAQDCFLSEISHRFDKIWFIVTMNDVIHIEPALRDRLKIVEVPDYSQADTIKIIQNYIIPEMLKTRGMAETAVSFTEEALKKLLSRISEEQELGSIRIVEKKISEILSKIALWSVSGKRSLFSFKVPNFDGYPYTVDVNSLSDILPPNRKDKPFHPMYN